MSGDVTNTSVKNFRNIIPIGSLTLGIVAAIFLHFFFPMQRIISYPYTLIGIIMIVLALLLFITTVKLYITRKTDLHPTGSPSSLLITGPFRYTRNPIYSANMIVLAGVSILLGSLSPFIVIPIYFLIVSTFVIPFEEAMLTKVFGDEYKNYQKSVRRWL